MEQKRKEEIFNKLVGYVSEHCSTEEDEYIAFTKIIGLTKEEMNELGIEFEKNYSELEDEQERD
ncbi:MAG: hypothetical protein HFJ53_03005 [Clostridia bacterium]|jgi:hypothetical protein|nr:hypothetical protein [Clostridia bacterium]